MSLIQLERVSVGEVGVLPGSIKMVSTDNLATITTAGYINTSVTDIQLSPSDVVECLYSFNVSTGAGIVAFFSPSVSNGVITLNFVGPTAGGVTLPVVSGDFAIFDGITGLIKDGGFLPSDSAKTRVVMLNAAPTVGHLAIFTSVNGTIGDGGVLGTAAAKAASDNTKPILASVGSATVATRIAKFVDVAGTIDDTAGNAVNLGDIIAGLGGVPGSFISFPPTVTNGSLIWKAIDAGGAFDTTVSNSVMGQSSVISIPDPANALGRFLVGATATPFTSGNFPVASGTGGLMIDSGLAASNIQNKTNIKAARTADIGGGGAGPLSVVVAGVTAASIIVGSIDTSSNPVSIQKITATATGFDILFSGDPGASCLVNYIACVVAQ